MKLYRLAVKITEPDEDSGGRFLAEVPLLPGCRAWGDSAAEAIESVHSVAAAFLQSYQEHGDELPQGIEPVEANVEALGDIVIAV